MKYEESSPHCIMGRDARDRRDRSEERPRRRHGEDKERRRGHGKDRETYHRRSEERRGRVARNGRREHCRSESRERKRGRRYSDASDSESDRHERERKHSQRPPRRVDDTLKKRRIAPNTSILMSILVNTNRSRDRLDHEERKQADRKLATINITKSTNGGRNEGSS